MLEHMRCCLTARFRCYISCIFDNKAATVLVINVSSRCKDEVLCRLRCTILYYVMLCYLSYLILYMLCYVMLCYVLLYYIILYYIISYHIISYYIISYYIILYYIILYYIILYYIILYYINHWLWYICSCECFSYFNVWACQATTVTT